MCTETIKDQKLPAGFSWMLRGSHTAQTQTNGQLPLSDHSIASRLTHSAKKLH